VRRPARSGLHVVWRVERAGREILRRLRRSADSRSADGADEIAPATSSPRHLAEKILTSRSALEGERKQVTVLFADVKGSTELAEQRKKEPIMRIPKDQIPAKINVPGAVARVATDFGDATGFGTMGGEYFSLGAGTDIAPLLKGLEDDACHAPHWGYMLSGELVVTYTNGMVDTCKENDLFYWPPGHSVRAVKDSEVILFSPQREHALAMDHMLNAMKG
jgi:hypothetical protein